MATFTIDLLTSKEYLFTGDFNGSGSTSGSTSWNSITNKPQWLSPNTLPKFQTGHTHSYNNLTNKLSGGTGIKLINNVINTTIENITLQLVDYSGGTEVNTIPETPIVWTTTEFSGTTFNFTGGSKILITENGIYGVGYTLNLLNVDNNTKTIGCVIRKNGNEDITTTTATSHILNFLNSTGTNVMAIYKVNLVAGDYLELVAYRIGEIGSVLTVANASWLTLIKY